ncbi:hypothetical protein D9615_003644 [Tricholomella constricta]|uniref:Uncharacterized protein n=1 Tax=Tricholomella constricta TaxID=117010 RepID=A0A8H5M7G4_9AGAR|nr:hypothetical protein D9615_003644 [Tricholomella constricta]
MSVPTFPPGNNYPEPGRSYVFTQYGTNQAFTLSGGEHIWMQPYSSTNQDQVFLCGRVAATNKLGFVNKPTNRRILRNQFEDVRAWPQNNSSVWESFSFEPLRDGGFRMSSMIGDKESAVRRVDEAGSWFTINSNHANSSPLIVGVTIVNSL